MADRRVPGGGDLASFINELSWGLKMSRAEELGAGRCINEGCPSSCGKFFFKVAPPPQVRLYRHWTTVLLITVQKAPALYRSLVL